MKQVIVQVSQQHYERLVNLLKTLDYVSLVAEAPAGGRQPQSYDFSDLAGKLQWEGNALAQQRTIRDEW